MVSMFSRASKWLSNHLPFRRNHQSSPTASGTEQQPRRENDSKHGANSPEHKAILSVTPQLVECLQRDPSYPLRLRDHLFAKKVISESNYQALDLCSAASIAYELMKVIAERIGYCDGHFYELINALELVQWAQDILAILNTARDRHLTVIMQN